MKIHFKLMTWTVWTHLFILSPFLVSLPMAYKKFHASRCMEYNDDVIKMVTSYLGCVKLCNKRGACKAISYRRLHGACTLHGQSESFTNLKPCRGFVYSRKSDWTQPGDGVCTCPRGHQCDDAGNCVPAECPSLDAPAHGSLLGNMAAIGNRMKLRCNPGYIRESSKYPVCNETTSWSGGTPTCNEDPSCFDYLIQAGDVRRSSSYKYSSNAATHSSGASCIAQQGLSAKFSRLDATGECTGAWAAKNNTSNEWIQVNFTEPRVVSGIALKGRDSSTPAEYVTKFRVDTSLDCTYWTAIGENGIPEDFIGTSGADVQVNRSLSERVVATCVRLNPITWVEWVALRFDVLGCHLGNSP